MEDNKPLMLGWLTQFMIPSDRLIIEDANKNVIYKGFVGCFQYQDIDKNRKVKSFGLSTDIFKKENRDRYLMGQLEYKDEIPADKISDFAFSDLEMLIYTKIILED